MTRKIEATVDVMVENSIDEIMSFLNSKAVKNPVMELIGAEIILLILTVPLLFGLLCVSIICREIGARWS